MAELTLFTKYTTLENRVTNYCGLMLKLMYEERPTSFAEVMHEMSAAADVVFLGLPAPEAGEEDQAAERLQEMVEKLPTAVLVRNSGPLRGKLLR